MGGRDSWAGPLVAARIRWACVGRPARIADGYGSELCHQGTTDCSPCFHLPGFHVGYLCLTHSQICLGRDSVQHVGSTRGVTRASYEERS